jgi:hypothetical protein
MALGLEPLRGVIPGTCGPTYVRVTPSFLKYPNPLQFLP